MSADQTRREINQLDNEIASLEKKHANLEQKEADRTRNINDVQKVIDFEATPRFYRDGDGGSEQ